MQPGSLPDPDFLEIGRPVPPTPSERLHRAVKLVQEQADTEAGEDAEVEVILLTTPAVYVAVKRILLTEGLAQEAVEETYIKAFSAIALYDPQVAPFEQWLLGIAISIAHEHRSLLEEEDQGRHIRFSHRGTEWVMKEVDDPMAWAGMASAFGLLPLPLQRLASLRYNERYSVRQLSRALGRSRRWVRLSLRRLRAILGGAR